MQLARQFLKLFHGKFTPIFLVAVKKTEICGISSLSKIKVKSRHEINNSVTIVHILRLFFNLEATANLSEIRSFDSETNVIEI
jgi:hypothetical protein